jgi:hypothetical protein
VTALATPPYNVGNDLTIVHGPAETQKRTQHGSANAGALSFNTIREQELIC